MLAPLAKFALVAEVGSGPLQGISVLYRATFRFNSNEAIVRILEDKQYSGLVERESGFLRVDFSQAGSPAAALH
jgi:hypothetical protein